jgi:hypothetical protein
MLKEFFQFIDHLQKNKKIFKYRTSIQEELTCFCLMQIANGNDKSVVHLILGVKLRFH